MNRLSYILLIISQLTFSQVTKNLAEFNKITSFDKIDVTLIQATENKIILNGLGSENVETEITNNELKIKMPLTKLLSGDNVSATVYFKKIEAIEANEGSRIAYDKQIDATIFSIIIKEGSEINVKLNCNKLILKASAGSKIDLEGKTTTQDILLNSGAVLRAKNFKSNQTTVTANTGAEAQVYASDFVDAKVRAGGSIYIYGKPKQINQKKIAGGKIEQAQ